MKLLVVGTLMDGFRVGDCLHAGGMAHIYQVSYADNAQRAPFPMVMKVPRMTAGDGAENIVGFEVELQILSVLSGPHVPRFVAAGDLEKVPYLVMEQVIGRTLQQVLDEGTEPLTAGEIARIGVAMAQAVHSLHLQDVCHLDLKPANVILRPDGSAVLLDFGLPPNPHDMSEGIATLREIESVIMTAKVIVLTGQDQQAAALAAIREGAFDFLSKPVAYDAILHAIQRAALFLQKEDELSREGITRIALNVQVGDGMKAIRADAEERLVRQILRETGFNVLQSARRLGVKRENIYYFINKYGIERDA